MKFEYLISYESEVGRGRCFLDLSDKIESREHVEYVERLIVEKFNYKKLFINNFILLNESYDLSDCNEEIDGSYNSYIEKIKEMGLYSFTARESKLFNHKEELIGNVDSFYLEGMVKILNVHHKSIELLYLLREHSGDDWADKINEHLLNCNLI